MTIRQYPKHNGSEGERGFTADEIRRGIHAVYQDAECENCGKVQPVAARGPNGECCACGMNTEGGKK